jgi:hypothetical protein
MIGIIVPLDDRVERIRVRHKTAGWTGLVVWSTGQVREGNEFGVRLDDAHGGEILWDFEDKFEVIEPG